MVELVACDVALLDAAPESHSGFTKVDRGALRPLIQGCI